MRSVRVQVHRQKSLPMNIIFRTRTGSYEELISDPAVDLVYVATPHNLHLENTLAALRHGKHVLCEKPMGVNKKEEEQMFREAKNRNLFLMEALWSRFLPNVIKTKALVDSGAIGEIKLMTAFFSIISDFGPQHRHHSSRVDAVEQ